MLRSFHLADFFTLANAACGMVSVFQAMMYVSTGARVHLFIASAMTIAALVFDVLDGRIARWRHQHSALGRELDSLADVISFGVAPAVLGFAVGLRGGWDVAALTYFVCCGVSRLARFNVTAETLSGGGDKVAYFEGTPIPTSVVIVALLTLAAWLNRVDTDLPGGSWSAGWDFHPLSLLFVLSGSLMISKTLRIPKL